jgi:subtilisin family serine protease
MGNNGIGITGGARNVPSMACKCLSAQGPGTPSDIIGAMDCAARMGVKVLSMSFGGKGPDPGRAYREDFSSPRDAGVMVVAAAGNESSKYEFAPLWPPNFSTKMDNLVSVGRPSAAVCRRPFQLGIAHGESFRPG